MFVHTSLIIFRLLVGVPRQLTISQAFGKNRV